MKVTSLAVCGRCRWVTTPATTIRVPSATSSKRAAGVILRASRSERSNAIGCCVDVTPVCATSAANNSNADIPGRDGTSTELSPESMSALSVAAIPAAHCACRRSTPKHSSAPALANASTWRTLNDALLARSAIPLNGASASIRSAAASPTPLTRFNPNRICPLGQSDSFFDWFTHTGRIVTPWRRASEISDCGE